MRDSLTLKTVPGVEPVVIADVKTHSVVEYDDDDAYLTELISTAREQVESDTGRALIEQVWELALDSFPAEIGLLRPPFIEVVSIKYIDVDGVQQTLDPAEYAAGVVSDLGRVLPAYGKCWPSIRPGIGAVVVEYKAGYGGTAADVPRQLKHAIMVLVEHFYENRGLVVTGITVSDLPQSYQSLIGRFEVAAL